MRLSRLLLERRAPEATVAWRWDSERGSAIPLDWRGFQRHVAGLRARLEQLPRGSWLLATEDTYAFAVGLFALWHSGRSAISAPNHQPGTLTRLQTLAAGVLSDRADWFSTGVAIHPLEFAAAGTSAVEPEGRPLSRTAPAIELFTSGTTGAGKSVSKRLSHLEEEVEVLERLWGELVGDAVVFGTASHQHLYGMLFRVLWPLAAGRPFQSDLVLHASELIPRMRARGACALASVPTHLKRMGRQRGVEALRGLCRVTFSSGGLLQSDTAQAWRDAVGAAPIEVFGSTETGGIAWRAQNELPRDCGWTPFPDVEIMCDPVDDRVRVRSPFVSAADENEGMTIGDHITWLPDGRFELGARLDRVVKIGEKRLDLAQMESALRAHALVDEVALVVIELESEARVAGVIVPSREGRSALERDGRLAYGRCLSESLAPDWDRVLLPRSWRSVDRLPENEQGKPTAQALRALFDGPDEQAPGSSNDAPEVIERRVSEGAIEQICTVPRDLSCFPDHFPGFPVVPGVLQLDWALNLAADLLGQEPVLRDLEALKFGSTLGPGDRFALRVERTGRSEFSFRVWSGKREFASGRARFAPEPPS